MHYLYSYEPYDIVTKKRNNLESLRSVSKAYVDVTVSTYAKRVIEASCFIQDAETYIDVESHVNYGDYIKELKEDAKLAHVQIGNDLWKRDL